MWDLAFAQTAQPPAGGSPFISFFPLVLVFIIFYFLLIRPQQKKAKEHRQMIDNLKKNDMVITSGGIHGRVIALTDTALTLEVAPNVRLRVERSHVSQLAGEKTSAKEAKAK
jgi:preprotein translocase subunit YajC